MLGRGSDEYEAETFVLAPCLMVLRLSVTVQSRLVVGGEKVNDEIDPKLEICQVCVRTTVQDSS